MDLIQILKEDHDFFRARFKQLRTLAQGGEIGANKSILSSLIKEVRKRHQIHVRRETEVLIPALLEAYRKQKINPADAFLIQHLQEEHLAVGRNVYLLGQEISDQNPSLRWVEKLEQLAAAYIPHMEREELTLFPEAEKYLPLEQLVKLARVPVSKEK